MTKILINGLAIQDSGGITVLEKLLQEIQNSSFNYLIVCNKNDNILNLIVKYKDVENFEFMVLENKGFLYRLYYENIIFRKLLKDKNIDLVYNFSGSTQFFMKKPNITKVHNLLFYSKKVDLIYCQNKEYLKWFKQIYIKRLVFLSMIKQTKYIEVQSLHVKNYLADFIYISNKEFFIKSDINFLEKDFSNPKNYNFSKKIKFLFIVGPHFEYLHKNFTDFVSVMIELQKLKLNFEINITLSRKQLNNSSVWNASLDENTNFLGYISKNDIKSQFLDNTILISTSVIETLGLHVIEAVQNGILAIVPNENYSNCVYGEDVLRYELFDISSLLNRIKGVILLTNNHTKDIITKNQRYLIENENKKYNSITEVFVKVIKETNV